MGQVTPNISIYVPTEGETNFDASYLAGMQNIDVHDHSGSPNRGVPIASPGIADFSITYQKLNSDVVLTGGGLEVDGGSPNKLKTKGILQSLYTAGVGGATGIIAKNAADTAIARTITGITGELTFSNGDGAAGNPTLVFPSPTTWTPTIFGSVNAGTITYTVQHGRYIKLGHFLSIFGQVSWSAIGTGAGNLMVGGFPFVFTAGGTEYISTLDWEGQTLPAGRTQACLSGNSAAFNATMVASGSGVARADVPISATGTLNFTMLYLM